MGIAFKNAAVHVGARIAFVGVTDNVLLVGRRVFGELPFASCREAGAAAAAQTGIDDFFNHRIRCHFEKNFFERGISVAGDVFVDDFRIDDSAVAQNDAQLFAVKADVAGTRIVFRFVFFIEQALDLAALDDVFGNNFVRVFRTDLNVEAFVGKDFDNRTLFAETEAAGFHQLGLSLDAGRFDFFFKRLVESFAFVGFTRGSRAYQNVVFVCHDYLPAFLMMSVEGLSKMWSLTSALPARCSRTMRRAVLSSTFP